jgi:pimeloyl-ACP methyl ester carboxylesterase
MLTAIVGATGRAETAPTPAATRSNAGEAGVIHKLPAGDRQYEVLLPPGEAAELKNLPLVMYLHPAGQPATGQARPTTAAVSPSARLEADWRPLLARRKCLLVPLASKLPTMWQAGEEQYLLDVLADVQARYSVDARRVILLGVSGGAQAALFLADHAPEKFRAVIAVSANPVVVRGEKAEWFYPNRKTLEVCPYFVVNPLTQGSALMYWRQVRAKLSGQGASISIVPVTGAQEFPAPPESFGPWLDEVLAGKQPKPVEDPQKLAVAKWMGPPAEQWAKQTGGAQSWGRVSLDGPSRTADPEGGLYLSVMPPEHFPASSPARMGQRDSTGAPMLQLKLEHKDWPIYLRWEVRQTARPMEEVLAEEEKANIQRGVLYQLYQTVTRSAPSTSSARPASGPATKPISGSTKPTSVSGPEMNLPPGALARAQQAINWRIRIGSITYPDRRRGWVTALFAHASSPLSPDGRKWVSVVLTDETQQPDAQELAGYLRAALGDVRVSFYAPTIKPTGGSK